MRYCVAVLLLVISSYGQRIVTWCPMTAVGPVCVTRVVPDKAPKQKRYKEPKMGKREKHQLACIAPIQTTLACRAWLKKCIADESTDKECQK